MRRTVLCSLWLVCLLEVTAGAQATHDHAQVAPTSTDTWQWTVDGTVFFGYNYQDRKHGNLEAYLLEGRLQLRPRDAVYARAESVAKDILDAGFHPPGVFHRHRQSQVGALTIGYVRDFLITTDGRFGLGGDITGYRVPDNLRDAYGSPVSYHVFVRYRGAPARNAGAPHVH